MTPSLEGWPTKVKETPPSHEIRLARLDKSVETEVCRNPKKLHRENYFLKAFQSWNNRIKNIVNAGQCSLYSYKEVVCIH